jgi:uncharacterized protein (TIGR02996 family)
MSEASFLAAICAAPDDDTPRLAFADYLEESGRGVRAAFVRDQIALAKLDEADPRYPELLARTRRGGVLTDESHRPECEQNLEAATFRRGFVAGLRTHPRSLPDALAQLPLEQLCLTRPGADEFGVGKAVAARPELARVRTLAFEYGWEMGDIADALAGPHLAGLRNLRIDQPHYDSADALRAAVAGFNLPALDSFALHFGTVPQVVPEDDDEDGDEYPDSDWDGFLPPRPLRRLHLTADEDTADDWVWPGPSHYWLTDRHGWPALEVADVTLEANPISGTDYVAAMPPGNLFEVLPQSRLTRLTINGSSLHQLLGAEDWGNVRELAVHDDFTAADLAELFTAPQAQQLERLTLCGDHVEHEHFDMGNLPDVIRTPGILPKLRRLSLRAELAALANGSYRDHLLRLDVGTPGILGAAWPALLDVPLPQLRHLTLSGFRDAKEFEPLFTAANAPNLCTLQLGDWACEAAAWAGIARNPATPHLSLLSTGTWQTKWLVVRDGEAVPVVNGVLPLDEDWWEPDPLRTWFW